LAWFDVCNIFLKYNGNKYLTTTCKKFCRLSSPVFVLVKVRRSLEGGFDSSIDGRDGDGFLIEPDRIGVVIVAYARYSGMGARYFIAFISKSMDRDKCFGSFGSCRDSKLRGESKSAESICFMMEGDSISIIVIPPCETDMVEGIGEGMDSRHNILGWDVEFYLDGLHEYHGSYSNISVISCQGEN
jgi:hypothetical protein